MQGYSSKEIQNRIHSLIIERDKARDIVRVALDDAAIYPMLKIQLENTVHDYFNDEFNALKIMSDVAEWYESEVNKEEKEKPYSYLDAMNDLSDVQFIDNTWQEGHQAREEVAKIIKGLCGVQDA